MKKGIFIIIGLVYFFVLSGCKKDLSNNQIKNLLLNWADSIKSLNYSKYMECSFDPVNRNSFEQMYKDFYFDNLKIIKISNEKKQNIDNKQYFYNDVEVILDVINRKTLTVSNMVYGNFKVLKVNNNIYKLSNKTLVYVEK